MHDENTDRIALQRRLQQDAVPCAARRTDFVPRTQHVYDGTVTGHIFCLLQFKGYTGSVDESAQPLSGYVCECEYPRSPFRAVLSIFDSGLTSFFSLKVVSLSAREQLRIPDSELIMQGNMLRNMLVSQKNTIT